MSGLLENPASAGLIAGLAIWLAQLIWIRTMGGPNEKSLPTNIAEMNVKLTEINTKLELAINENKHLQKDVDQLKKDVEHIKKNQVTMKEFEELKNDFWNHLDKLHGTPAMGTKVIRKD